MAEGLIHKRLKLLGLKFLKKRVVDLVCIEAKYRNMRSIADVCGINLKRKEVRIIEVKASRQDYLRDKKIFDIDQSYYKHCQYFYIMCPTEILQLNEVPKEYGLIWVDENDNITVKRNPKKYNDKVKTTFVTSLKNVCRALTNNYLYKYIYPLNNIEIDDKNRAKK
jgi:hypothetical protein